MWDKLLENIANGHVKNIARAISLVENEVAGYNHFLASLPHSSKKVIGITGPPGAGKSTLVDALIEEIVKQNQSVAVLCIDPSSPFNLGALLGDRIRMNQWYNHPNVYIRSLATRGSLGGLHPKILEITDVLKQAPFNHIIVETVGVGQSEIEIAGLADTTIVTLVPEAGDEVQTMKAGIMEIADIFVVNKADRPEADLFVKNLKSMLAPAFNKMQEIPILKTIASTKNGVDVLLQAILKSQHNSGKNEKYYYLLTQKAYHLIQQKRMQTVNKQDLYNSIKQLSTQPNFNIYKFVNQF